MRLLAILLVALSVTSLPAPESHAQTASQATVPRPILTDPVVNANRTVTFRVVAPPDALVELSLEGRKDSIPMTMESRGIFTLTTEPLAPEFYSYHFLMNKHLVIDPHNVSVKASLLAVGSSFLVPGATPEPWESTAIPHGEVHHEFFTTHVVKGLERDQDEYYVYTPPGYDPRSPIKYPVLYLLHGWSDTAGGWSTIGHANDILDTLIASGKARPMIVVMPLGYGEMSFVRSGFDVWNDPAQVVSNVKLFGQSLLTEILPRVEKEYNIQPGRDARAIAGLSMGGLESVAIGLERAQMFSYVGGFSAAVMGLTPERLLAGGLDPKTANFKLLWIACGTEDDLITPNRTLIAGLKGLGLPVTAVETPGMHTWLVWRDNLVNFVPLLFQK